MLAGRSVETVTPGPWEPGAFPGVHPTTGSLSGGFLVESAPWGLSWRTIFLVVLPVALPGAWFIGRSVPADPSRSSAARPSVDPAGLGGLSAGLLLIFAAVTLAPESHWPWWGWLLIAAGGLALTTTVRWENRQAARGQPALIDTALFWQGVFRTGLGINSAYFLAFGGVLFVMTYTLQEGLHETAEASGLTFVPQGAAFAVASLIGARLATRTGPRLITAGALASSTACALLLLESDTGGIAVGPGHLWPVMALLGAGNGLAIPAMIASVLRVVAGATSGTAAGVLTTTQQVSMAFGVAILGSIQTIAVSRTPGPAGYVTGLKITLLIAAVLLAIAAVGSVTLQRAHPRPHRK